MNPTERFYEDFSPRLLKEGFVFAHGIFFKAVGDIMMAVTCPEDCCNEIWCAVFPVWEADIITGVSVKYHDLSESRRWVREFRLSNVPDVIEETHCGFEASERAPEPVALNNFFTAHVRFSVCVLGELMSIRDFTSYMNWRANEYCLTRKEFTPHEMIMRARLDGDFEFTERYLLRRAISSGECDADVRKRFIPYCECLDGKDTSFIEDYAEEKRKRLIPYFVSAFPDAFVSDQWRG
jgi:hypothetical protein